MRRYGTVRYGRGNTAPDADLDPSAPVGEDALSLYGDGPPGEACYN
jgi:hypothetical protein